MQPTERQRFLSETAVARDKAEHLLKGLLAAHAECETQLQKLNRRDTLKAVTGRSALDNAVAATRRMIESLDRAMQDALREDAAVLEEAAVGAAI